MSRKFLGKNLDQSKITKHSSILDPIVRKKEQSKYKDIQIAKYGVDFWNAYEFSYLDKKGLPCLTILEISIPSKSPITVESKSLKIYLNTFFDLSFKSKAEVLLKIQDDLSGVCKFPVLVKFKESHPKIPKSISLLKIKARFTEPNRIYKFDAFRSLCPVTNQPDWATIYLRSDCKMDIAFLNEYFLTFRGTGEFHELCIDKIFTKIHKEYLPDSHCVYGRFLRRGGIDINPMRSSSSKFLFKNHREYAQ